MLSCEVKKKSKFQGKLMPCSFKVILLESQKGIHCLLSHLLHLLSLEFVSGCTEGNRHFKKFLVLKF